MASKKNANSSLLKWTSPNGSVNEFNVDDIRSYEDTKAFAQSAHLWGAEVPEFCISREPGQFDPDGRESITGKNMVALDARWLKGKDYGNYYSVLAYDVESEQVGSFLTRGQVLNDAFEIQTGISLKDGSESGSKEMPFKFRIVFTAAGDYDGYYEVVPWAEAGELVEA